MRRPHASQVQGNRIVPSERQDLHRLIEWLKVVHPKVMFYVDYGADALLTPRQAAERKRLAWGRGWPDLLIFEERAVFLGKPKVMHSYVGLAMDLKREDVRIYKGNSMYASDHIERQAEVMALLNDRGWYTGFAKGFDGAVKLITDYLSISL